jgi:hypothetical protein
LLFRVISEILQKGPWTLRKSTCGPNFVVRPLIFENNPKRVPSLRKIHKNSPETSKFHIFSTTTPNPVILAPKFSELLLLSFYAFI